MKFLITLFLFLLPMASSALEVKGEVLKETVKEIRIAEQHHKLPVDIWVGQLHGNDSYDPLHRSGRRSNLIVHHEHPESNDHYIIVWFHGMGGYHKFSSNIFPQLSELIKRGKSFTLVEPELPWSCNVSNIDGRKSWLIPGSFRLLVESAQQIFPLKSKKRILLIVGGHSRGGKSIRDATIRGGLCEMNPHGIIWSDASYSSWLDVSWQACLNRFPEKVEIFYIRRTETETPIKRLLKKDKHFVSVNTLPLGIPWYHGKVGDNALVISSFLK